MKILRRYFASEIYRSVTFVLVAFLALFAFFDLMGELGSIGRDMVSFIDGTSESLF